MSAVTTANLDYLQRLDPLAQDAGGAVTAGETSTRRLLHVRGTGVTQRRTMIDPTQSWRPRTAQLVSGLHGYGIPVALSVFGEASGVTVKLGTWSARVGRTIVEDRRSGVLESVLRGLYPSVELESSHDEEWTWPVGGLTLGIPAPSGADHDGSVAWDQVIRSMRGREWQVLVVAYPLPEQSVRDLREAALNELRSVRTGVESKNIPAPLGDYYGELLTTHLRALGEGLAIGAWRTAVYLLGDETSYPNLVTAWRSVFSTSASLPEPVRVFTRPDVNELAQRWALPDAPGPPGPGFYHRPFEFQTIMSATQLAACLHLPEVETPGFAISVKPPFDSAVTRAVGSGKKITVGAVQHHDAPTGAGYDISLASLTRHVLVCGVTGSGKTNTIFSLLAEADAAGLPFLVLEPAKAEYRALLEHPTLGPRVRVFTAGKSTVAPFLLNPFEVPDGTTVGEHIDLLRSAFLAAFGMWTPLPQVLERCLHAAYTDRGWDLRSDSNSRVVGDDRGEAFPTLSELIAKVDELVPTLGYEDKIAGDLRAALSTRLESLARGGKGAMFDTSQSVSFQEFLEGPTVIELEPMGDEGDKAFLAGLILIRLAEHRRAQGQIGDLRHLIVIEEAHRLLRNVSSQAAEGEANPRGQAVETFSNLLSEIRAYGQGVVIADQVPVRLAPDVLKNTNLKIVHRIVSGDDRAALAATMAMDPDQSNALVSLGVGSAVVFSEGDDGPVLVRIPLTKDPLSSRPPTDAVVRDHMKVWYDTEQRRSLFVARPFCAQTCRVSTRLCENSRRLTTDRYARRCFARVALSVVEEADAMDRMWDDLVDLVASRRPYEADGTDVMRSALAHLADGYASRLGAEREWTYPDTAALGDSLRAVLLDKLQPVNRVTTEKVRSAYQGVARDLHKRMFEPYPSCAEVCNQDPPLCLYRNDVAAIVLAGRYGAAWSEADAADSNAGEGRRNHTWQVCRNAASDVKEASTPDMSVELGKELDMAHRRVALCFQQQMLAIDKRKLPSDSRRILAETITEAVTEHPTNPHR